nr:putative reverse transcriptase domain-containing protein [Tanacetum cinerariifolium]
MTLEGVNVRVAKLAAVQEQDTQDMYAVTEDTQDRFRHFRLEVRLMQMIARALNNMPPKKTSATARAAAAARADAVVAPMIAAIVEQLFEARVSVAHANHETLRNRTNDQGDGSHNSDTRMGGTVRTPCECCYSRCCFCYGLEDTKENDDRQILPKGMFHEESDEVEKYVGGLPDMLRGNVVSYQPNTMAKAIDFANDQMDQKCPSKGLCGGQCEDKPGLYCRYGINQGNETHLNIISCTKTQKYLLKGHHVFLAHVTTKETKDKSGEKRLEDVPIVRDFPEAFPKELPGLPPTRQVEFQIDLMPGVAPVA